MPRLLVIDDRDQTVEMCHRHLPQFGMHIGCGKRAQGLLRGTTRAHECQAQRAVTRIDERLCRHHTHAGLAPNDQRSDRKPMRLHGHTQFTGRRVAGNDRISMNRPRGPTGFALSIRLRVRISQATKNQSCSYND